MSHDCGEEHSGGSRNFFTGIWTSMTSGSGSPTLLCLLRALIGGFRPKHPLMDFAMLGEGLEGAQLGSQLLDGDSRHCCW